MSDVLSELLDAAAEWDRPKAFQRRRRRRDAAQEAVGVLVAVATVPAVVGAGLDAGFEEGHRPCEVLVLRLVDEGVVPECCAVRAHWSSIQASCCVSA